MSFFVVALSAPWPTPVASAVPPIAARAFLLVMDEFIVIAFLASEPDGFDRPEPTPVFVSSYLALRFYDGYPCQRATINLIMKTNFIRKISSSSYLILTLARKKT